MNFVSASECPSRHKELGNWGNVPSSAATLFKHSMKGNHLLSNATAKATTMATVEPFPMTLEAPLMVCTGTVGDGHVPFEELGKLRPSLSVYEIWRLPLWQR